MSNCTWEYIKQHPQEVKRLLRISYEQLEQLIEQGKMLHQIKQEKSEKQKRGVDLVFFLLLCLVLFQRDIFFKMLQRAIAYAPAEQTANAPRLRRDRNLNLLLFPAQ